MDEIGNHCRKRSYIGTTETFTYAVFDVLFLLFLGGVVCFFFFSDAATKIWRTWVLNFHFLRPTAP